MAKRFINPDWKKLRGLSANLQRAYFYCWDKADACGVYEFDPLYIKADLGINISLAELGKLPNAKILPNERLFFTDFIEVNFGTLKEDYNPHKPTFRALAKNKISSLNQACPILEEEEEGEEEGAKEGEEEKEEGAKVEVLNPFGQTFTAWQGWKDYKKEEHRQSYRSPKTESTALKHLYELARGNPETAIAIIEQSIANNWKGLFEIKNNGNSKTKTGFSRQGIQAELDKRFANGG